MSRLIAVCVAALALTSSHACIAGGLFRRVPEVGEWARYEITQDFHSNPGKRPAERYTGEMLLQCVGEEMVDERRCLWVEYSYEMRITDKFESRFAFKVLVPEDEMLQGTLTEEDIRGWFQEDKAAPVELTFSDDLSEDSGGSCLVMLNAGASASTGQMSSRSVVVNEDEIELTYFESSPLPIREYGINVMSGEVTIWPHDDLAFGVVSMDWESLQTYQMGEFSNETLNETRFYLLETGIGAVSELPDYN